MSDYTTPAVTDETAAELAKQIGKFGEDVSRKLDDILDRHYAVNHEPQIELPFGAEYEYICGKVENVNQYPHIFLSGYLPSGAKLRYNQYSPSADTQDNFSAVYINGSKVDLGRQQEYLCRAEEGSRERINILIVGNSRLAVDYADYPLEAYKMIVFDDNGDPVYPEIASFCSSLQIDTLKYIGNMKWTSSELSTLRRLEVTGDIYVTGNMRCVCLRDLIIPNVTNVPNVNIDCDSKTGLINVDISNVRGAVGYLQYARLGDLKLNCTKIIKNGLNGARIDSLDTGNYCTNIEEYALANSEVEQVKLGISVTNIGYGAFINCQALRTITFNNLSGVAIDNFVFSNCTSLTTMNFKAINSVSYGNWLNNAISITTLTFIPKSITCALYFNASAVLSEQSCINIINAIADDVKINVSLNAVVKDKMANMWYCKLSDDGYVSCTADDESAVTQAEALLARGGTLV